MLVIRLLGDMQVLRDAEPIELPRSRKTRALLGFLAATCQPHRRERLGELLWDAAEDPRGSLRWSLSQIRLLTAAAERPLVIADRDTVRFDPLSASVDLTVIRALVADDLATAAIERLQDAVAAFRGAFLGDIELVDDHAFRSWCIAQREDARRLHALLRAQLAERLASSPDAALPHARVLVTVEPSSELAWSRLIRLLLAAGRHREAQLQYETAERALRGAGGPAGPLLQAWREASAAAEPPAPSASAATEAPTAAQPRPAVRFCVARDGVRIAHSAVGTGPPLVRVANWMTHIEHDALSPAWGHWIRAFSLNHRLVLYDQRGSGLSDRDVDDFSADALARDLEAVVADAGLTRVPLLGFSQGCAAAIAYAVKHPDRVSHLIFFGGFAQGAVLRTPHDAARRQAMGVLFQQGWDQDNPAVRQMITSLVMPDASGEAMRRFNELQRQLTSSANLARIHDVWGHVDIRSLLPQVRCPTLVLHARDDGITPFEEGRRLAIAIPGARFVALDSRSHLLIESEPAWPRFLAEVRTFLGEG
ncbi:alpha/beta fold hydrolase [Vineibacter terrae]|uniref:Alpha/beta fold hydrolase n=1 Tax=Vineibacter terrae TaxID=2586908 RepID=A0A5C8PJW1_9HYPH|nr:alpha/beta fold hydrolase [Vineibacter terrae]TXL74132.1 alpha/beta fold hydrolase [Vineibacter terrae]